MDVSSPKGNTTISDTAQTAAEQKPESSQNKSPAGKTEDTAAVSPAELQTREGTQPSQQPQISEEDRKALENLATAIGIPQIVQHMKEQDEKLNLLLGAKTGIPGTPAVGGAAAGFMGPLLAKAPEAIDKIIGAIERYVSGPPTGTMQPTMISGIDKEIMEAAIKQTMEVKQKVALANEALAKIYMGGGSVMVDQDGNAVILKPKKPEEKKE